MQISALVVPAAARTWEALTTLLGTQQQTGRVPVSFTRPVRVIAAYPSICVISATNGLIVPSLDDLALYIDISSNERLTARFDRSQVQNTEAGQFVTLGSFRDTTGGARLLDLDLKEPSPVLGLNFMWKRDITGGPFYPDILVGLALHCEWAENVHF